MSYSIELVSEQTIVLSELADEWHALYALSTKNPFLSWEWTHNNLTEARAPHQLLRLKYNDQTVGLGFIYLRIEGLKKVAYLNRTGEPKFDQVWIEYNAFLLDAECESQATTLLAEYCYQHLKCDELVVGGSLKSQLTPFHLYFTQSRVEWYSQTYQVDLQNFTNKDAFLASLSSNTRYQISRSEREYQKFGDATVSRADSVEQALEWLDAAAPHHIARWKSTQVGSGFENPHFVQFHKRFITDCFGHNVDGNGDSDNSHNSNNTANSTGTGNGSGSSISNTIDFLKISYGDHVIAYLYNFIVNERVYFYLSANVYEDNAKHTKPGLVAHSLAIEYYINKGFKTYDFMGGESQYKRSLATQGEPISIVRFQRNNLLMRTENTLRKYKRKFCQQPQSALTENKRLLITGGALNRNRKSLNGVPTINGTANGSATHTNTQNNQAPQAPQYNQAIICQIDIGSHPKPFFINSLEYIPDVDAKVSSASTNITFKSASLYKNLLYVPTETEIKVIDITTMQIVHDYSLPCFNDLHHVIKHNNALYIANTGLDVVTELDTITQSTTHHRVLENVNLRPLNKNIDYRQIASTKPHLAHPNFCFELDGQIWVTRCDLMDAVCINDMSKRIFIGDGLVHDGVVNGKYIYFTTVDGHIKVFDKTSFNIHSDVDLKVIAPQYQGWYRGICPISQGSVLVAMSKPRRSKRGGIPNQQSTLLLVDIYLKKVLQTWDLGELGLDAVFSVIEVPTA